MRGSESAHLAVGIVSRHHVVVLEEKDHIDLGVFGGVPGEAHRAVGLAGGGGGQAGDLADGLRFRLRGGGRRGNAEKQQRGHCHSYQNYYQPGMALDELEQ